MKTRSAWAVVSEETSRWTVKPAIARATPVTYQKARLIPGATSSSGGVKSVRDERSSKPDIYDAPDLVAKQRTSGDLLRDTTRVSATAPRP